MRYWLFMIGEEHHRSQALWRPLIASDQGPPWSCRAWKRPGGPAGLEGLKTLAANPNSALLPHLLGPENMKQTTSEERGVRSRYRCERAVETATATALPSVSRHMMVDLNFDHAPGEWDNYGLRVPSRSSHGRNLSSCAGGEGGKKKRTSRWPVRGRTTKRRDGRVLAGGKLESGSEGPRAT